MKVYREALCLLLVCCLLATAVPVHAVGISPLFANVDSVGATIDFLGTTATCNTLIKGKSGTTAIKATMTLSRKNANGTYTALTSWTPTSSSTTLNYSGSYDVTRGYTYRVEVTAVVTRNGADETATVSAEKACS